MTITDRGEKKSGMIIKDSSKAALIYNHLS